MTYDTFEPDVTKGQRVRVACAQCGNTTNHEVSCSVDHKWGDEEVQGINHYQVVRCLGCDSMSYRSVSSNSEDLYIENDGSVSHFERVEIYPPRTAGRRKLPDSRLLPHEVEYIYDETHKALCSDMRVLAAIGIRSLVEAVCSEEERLKAVALRGS